MARLTNRWLVVGLCACGLLAGLAGLASRSVGAMQWLEQRTIDARFSLRGDRPASSDVVVVALDGSSLRRLPRPPLPRGLDARLIDQLHRAGVRVIAFDFSLQQQTSRTADGAVIRALERSQPAIVSVADVRKRDRLPDPLAGRVAFSPRVRPGSTLLRPDRDGTIRAFPSGLGRVPSFAAAVAQAFTGRVPSTDSARRALIDYPGPTGTVPQLSFADVLNGRFEPRAVRGKIAVIGPAAPVLQDIHPTPVDPTMIGPEIQADAIATALHDFPLRGASAIATTWTLLGLGFVVPMLALGVLAIRRWARGASGHGIDEGGLGTVAVAVIGAGAVFAWSVAAQLSFNRGAVLDYADGLIVLAVATVLVWAGAARAERRERARLRTLFAAQSPEVVERVLRNPRADRGILTASTVIAGYRIDEEIGRGGMGVVYRATQLHLDRPVALKLIRPEFADEAIYRTRFVRESRLAASLSHPNIIPVFDAGDDAGLLYISMQYVEGINLARVLQSVGHLTPPVAARLVHQIGGALDAAHARGLVHRDVKPANIVIPSANTEHAFLTDFGLAKAVDETRADSEADGWAGTIDYLAPEQLEGTTVDGLADVYALTAVLYHCLTGTVPFPMHGVRAKMLAHLNTPRPVASDERPTLPPEIDAVIARGMAIEPDQRYQSATELTSDACRVLGVSSSVTVNVPMAEHPSANQTELHADGFSTRMSDSGDTARVD